MLKIIKLSLLGLCIIPNVVSSMEKKPKKNVRFGNIFRSQELSVPANMQQEDKENLGALYLSALNDSDTHSLILPGASQGIKGLNATQFKNFTNLIMTNIPNQNSKQNAIIHNQLQLIKLIAAINMHGFDTERELILRDFKRSMVDVIADLNDNRQVDVPRLQNNFQKAQEQFKVLANNPYVCDKYQDLIRSSLSLEDIFTELTCEESEKKAEASFAALSETLTNLVAKPTFENKRNQIAHFMQNMILHLQSDKKREVTAHGSDKQNIVAQDQRMLIVNGLCLTNVLCNLAK